MSEAIEQPNTWRNALEANMEASEAGTLGQVQDSAPVETAEQTAQRARDEQGRFAANKTEAENVNAAPVESQAVLTPTPPEPSPQRPTTWKKEYLPIYDKLVSGAPLTPEESRKLADYSGQREKEYATGVSTYKAEAQNARHIQEAMEPFMPSLQQHNMKPADWIKNLGTAHQTLVFGTPEEKFQMFSHMAKTYGVPLEGITQSQNGDLNPIVSQLMAEIQTLKQGVNTVTSWREQQDQQQMQQMVAKFEDAEKYPHFQQVREPMAQLLESGVAKDLDSAYAKAIRLDDEVWQAEQERQANANAIQAQAKNTAAVVKAKAAAVSTKTTTPSGTATNSNVKDRRATLSEQFESMGSGRV